MNYEMRTTTMELIDMAVDDIMGEIVNPFEWNKPAAIAKNLLKNYEP